jgi:hypothetical protein
MKMGPENRVFFCRLGGTPMLCFESVRWIFSRRGLSIRIPSFSTETATSLALLTWRAEFQRGNPELFAIRCETHRPMAPNCDPPFILARRLANLFHAVNGKAGSNRTRTRTNIKGAVASDKWLVARKG